jgi:hypothetical protein
MLWYRGTIMPEFQTFPEGMPDLNAGDNASDEPMRRDALKAIAAGAALFQVLPAVAQHAHHAAEASAAPAYTPQLIVGAQRDLLTAVCDRIIPRTDTPGAADAGVADEIDFMATRRRALAAQVAAALRRVEAVADKPFPTLSTAEQDAVLRKMSTDLSTEDGKAFTLLKDLTIDAYYRTKAGLMQELGWNANTYLPEFKGCTHEHAPVASLSAASPVEVAE